MGPGTEAPFWVLAGDKEKALRKYRQWLVQVPSPQFAFMAALLSDELKERTGVVTGSCLGGKTTEDDLYHRYYVEGKHTI